MSKTNHGKRKLQKDSEEEIDKNDQLETAKKPSMPTYGKHNILKILKENHCLIADREILLNAFPRKNRYDLEDITKFVNKTAKKSQSLTEKNNKSVEFQRADELIKAIEAEGTSTQRQLDIPLSLKTITDVYDYEGEDVDLRMLYQTLTNLSLGFPTGTLDTATDAFLFGIYKELVQRIDSKEFQEDVRKYQSFIKDSGIDMIEEKHCPALGDMHQVVKSAVSCPSINPLGIPFPYLRKPKNTF